MYGYPKTYVNPVSYIPQALAALVVCRLWKVGQTETLPQQRLRAGTTPAEELRSTEQKKSYSSL